MTKMANWTAEEKNRLAATIKAALEMPLPEPEFIEITESAAPGTKGRTSTVNLADGKSQTWAVKTATCTMFGRWIDAHGEEHWSPVTQMFKTVDGLMKSDWLEMSRRNSAWNFVEFRIAKVK